MPIVQTSLFALLKRFPNSTDVIKRLFREDKAFQSICEDYRRCAEAIEHWRRSTSEEASLLRKEYENLLQDLETEIQERLNNLDR
jgi:hypothetical protein